MSRCCFFTPLIQRAFLDRRFTTDAPIARLAMASLLDQRGLVAEVMALRSSLRLEHYLAVIFRRSWRMTGAREMPGCLRHAPEFRAARLNFHIRVRESIPQKCLGSPLQSLTRAGKYMIVLYRPCQPSYRQTFRLLPRLISAT